MSYDGLTEKAVVRMLLSKFFIIASECNDDENIVMMMWLVDKYREACEGEEILHG